MKPAAWLSQERWAAMLGCGRPADVATQAMERLVAWGWSRSAQLHGQHYMLQTYSLLNHYQILQENHPDSFFQMTHYLNQHQRNKCRLCHLNY
jgi:hypothetical protein